MCRYLSRHVRPGRNAHIYQNLSRSSATVCSEVHLVGISVVPEAICFISRARAEARAGAARYISWRHSILLPTCATIQISYKTLCVSLNICEESFCRVLAFRSFSVEGSGSVTAAVRRSKFTIIIFATQY